MRENRERSDRRAFRCAERRFLLVPCALLAGCLVPLPLEQQTPTDGGQLLVVKGANPSFGTRAFMQQYQSDSFDIDVISESPNVAGRLYLQGNGKCCELDVTKPESTRYLLDGTTEALSSNPGRYTIRFRTVVPCSHFLTVSPVFLVPVIASGGFSSKDPIAPNGQGEIDDTHYWTVTCP